MTFYSVVEPCPVLESFISPYKGIPAWKVNSGEWQLRGKGIEETHCTCKAHWCLQNTGHLHAHFSRSSGCRSAQWNKENHKNQKSPSFVAPNPHMGKLKFSKSQYPSLKPDPFLSFYG